MSAHTTGVPALPRDRWGIRNLELGISLGGASTVAQWRRMLTWVDLAEHLGLHSIWLPEMHFSPGSTSSPLVCLAAVVRRTRRIRLATTSLLLPIHHPLRIAQEIASLDHLSGGRVIIGLGRGFRAPLFKAFGIDRATKRDRFDRSLDLIRRTWAGETVRLADTPFEYLAPDWRGPPARPLQVPHPPLAVAAFGRKGLQQAARHALPYLASPVEPFDLIRDNLAFHQDSLPPGTDRTGRVIPVMRTVFVSRDEREISRIMSHLEAETRLPRTGGPLPSALAQAVAAPIDERVVVGGLAEVADRLAAYREQLGMNLLIVRPQLEGVSHESLEESLVILMKEIVPALDG